MRIKEVLVVKAPHGDLECVVRRRGARVVIDADSPAQARMIVRRIDGLLAGDGNGTAGGTADSQAIGFRADAED